MRRGWLAPRHAYCATRNLASPDATHGLVPVVRTHFTGTSTSAFVNSSGKKCPCSEIGVPQLEEEKICLRATQEAEIMSLVALQSVKKLDVEGSIFSSTELRSSLSATS